MEVNADLWRGRDTLNPETIIIGVFPNNGEYSGTRELGTPNEMWKTVLNSEVVLFLRSNSMYRIGLRTEVAVLNSQDVPISQVVLKGGFTVFRRAFGQSKCQYMYVPTRAILSPRQPKYILLCLDYHAITFCGNVFSLKKCFNFQASIFGCFVDVNSAAGRKDTTVEVVV